jgi:hypothetical protein
MYPNPQDVLPLAAHADLEQYRERARELADACRAGDDSIYSWATEWLDGLLERQGAAVKSPRRESDRQARQLADFARERLMPVKCALTEAQFVIARAHGFASWPILVSHIEGLSDGDSSLAAFERAADAIVAGELPVLQQQLATHPGLVHARSTREHRAALLHYVSANGVENYRQKTPPNIVAIACALLDGGAEVDAEADVYGGGATTLGLVVTSAHPRHAGVQNALADLLLDRGARVDAGIVRSCLMNGCPEAAAHMAARGASVNLEEAAGIGRLDVIARYFEPTSTVSSPDAVSALIMASWYDQREVVTFLLDHGVDVGGRAPKDGDTALHIAAYRGSSALVELLLRRGAPVNVTDAVYGTPPLVWALHAWLVEGRTDADSSRAVVRMLADAGAEVRPEWLTDDLLRADPDLHATLSRRLPGP